MALSRTQPRLWVVKKSNRTSERHPLTVNGRQRIEQSTYEMRNSESLGETKINKMKTPKCTSSYVEQTLTQKKRQDEVEERNTKWVLETFTNFETIPLIFPTCTRVSLIYSRHVTSTYFCK